MTLYGSNFNEINLENWHNTIEYNFWDENNILKASEKSTFEYNEDGYPTFKDLIYQYEDGTQRFTTVYYEHH